jgi:UDP-N-acetylmuramate--alanine ligase
MNRIHFLGINGSGMAGVACLAKLNGFEVSGCDINRNGNYSQQLLDLDIRVDEGHSSKHLDEIDMLVLSPAVFFNDKYKDIEEIKVAMKKDIPILKWQEFLNEYLVGEKKLIGVCGTHGKTSTTTILSNVLEDLGCEPSAIIGGINPRWDSGFRNGNGKYFVCESDEYFGNFHAYYPDYVILNNMEMEHPEYFSDYSTYQKNFSKFLKNIKKMVR